MVNHGNFLRSLDITVPSSITQELEKTCFPTPLAELTRKVFFSWGFTWPIKNYNKMRAEDIFMLLIVQEGEFSRRKSTEAIASLIRWERGSQRKIWSPALGAPEEVTSTRPFLQSHQFHKILSFVSLYHSNSATSSELLRANPLKIHSVIQGFIAMETAYNRYFL